MIERSVKIINQIGLHARPAALVVNKAKTFSSSVEFIKNGRSYNAKSIMSVLSMAAKMGEEVLIRADGEDEDIAAAELSALIESGLGEK
jgi:phosphocarrier protein